MYTVLAVWLLSIVHLQAQQTETNEQIEILEARKEQVVEEEKDALKSAVEGINLRLENNEIELSEAERLKEEAAERHALNIENRLAIIDNRIALLRRNDDPDYKYDDSDRLMLTIELGDEDDSPPIYIGKAGKARKYDRRTTSHFVFAFGLNNVITEGESLSESDYKVAGSRFAELGWAWKTRVFKNSNWLRIKYGFSFQYNGLKATDNRYQVDTGRETELQDYPESLNKSKFRVDYLVFPVHFEFGPSRKIEKKEYFRYSTRNQLKFGVGGYSGFRLRSRQKLKFDDENGNGVKVKEKGDFNATDFIYGLSAYVGWREVGLYVKYDLNTLFRNNPVEQRNVSLGLRFDMN
jgi:hypothetical protein